VRSDCGVLRSRLFCSGMHCIVQVVVLDDLGETLLFADLTMRVESIPMLCQLCTMIGRVAFIACELLVYPAQGL